ncbi:hypothetical protein ABPG72_003085 [Tetrahymena utriculariae]
MINESNQTSEVLQQEIQADGQDNLERGLNEIKQSQQDPFLVYYLSNLILEGRTVLGFQIMHKLFKIDFETDDIKMSQDCQDLLIEFFFQLIITSLQDFKTKDKILVPYSIGYQLIYYRECPILDLYKKVKYLFDNNNNNNIKNFEEILQALLGICYAKRMIAQRPVDYKQYSEQLKNENNQKKDKFQSENLKLFNQQVDNLIVYVQENYYGDTLKPFYLFTFDGLNLNFLNKDLYKIELELFIEDYLQRV